MRKALITVIFALLACLTGCADLGYYWQSVSGHLALMQAARPVDVWLADLETPEKLKARLALTQKIRNFAVSELKLPDNASYQRYADLGRPAAVWNMVATPELSLKLKTWCFPLLGCVGYRGYFDRAEADRLADSLRAQGLEVSVYGAPAYSTLGWTNWMGGDPLLNTFVAGSEAGLARLVFHELAHQEVYVPGDTMFNESYATAVERLGLRQWRASGHAAAEDVAAVQRLADFRTITRRTRAALLALYGSPAGEFLSDGHKRQRKADLLATMRADFAALKANAAGPWAAFTGYDDWLARANNASLALQAAYDGLVPDFERLFEREGRDFGRFHAAVHKLADLPADERRATLQAGP